MKSLLCKRYACLLTLAMTALLLCSCSSFNRAWKQAGTATSPADSIEGRWDGRWVSAKNGHSGSLRCLIAKNEDGLYTARFRATYMKILRFSYTIPLAVIRSNEVWYFRSEADLGAMAGGVYEYEGMTTSTHFHSTYTSKYDHGDFQMSRPVQSEKSDSSKSQN